MQRVLSRVLELGYAHHIERLRVLSNFSALAGLDPLAVNGWFTGAFIDTFDWVIAPNVLRMGLKADGGIIASTPDITSANYINKVSDYCPTCGYDHKKRTARTISPSNTLYWKCLIDNEKRLRANPRLERNVLGLRYLDGDERQCVIDQGEQLLKCLSNATV